MTNRVGSSNDASIIPWASSMLSFTVIFQLCFGVSFIITMGTFHSFLDRISADVQKWHDDTMLVSCLVQELPIFLARWEMSVERTFKYIAKRSAKKARRVAKTKAKDMTQQANSRVIALGGLPAPLWTSESSARTT